MNPNYVKVINSVWNSSPFCKRRRAERLVSEGRAVWVADSQIKLIPHPKNAAVESDAACSYCTPQIATLEQLRNTPFDGPQRLLVALLSRRAA